jgi:pimeloyl-ACP methyl ester carboxylesterase
MGVFTQMLMRYLVCLVASLAGLACAQSVPAATTGLQNDVVLSDYPPLAGSEALVERLLTPLAATQIHRDLERQHARLRDRPIDLNTETFTLFVPAQPPPQGYGLLVFISPRPTGYLPEAWIPLLERHGLIFVCAANSGNLANVMERRVPLALSAAYNIMRRYSVDPAHVYIGGMSGGARVALRMALAYPDLFHGVLLHSESDAIGDSETPLPSGELFREFQQSTRVVFLSGLKDRISLVKGEETRASLKEWCVADVGEETMALSGHEYAGAADFERALNSLQAHAAPNPRKVAACQARKSGEIAAKLQQVRDLLGRGKNRDALSLLHKIDRDYGGMAAPESVELEAKIGPQ